MKVDERWDGCPQCVIKKPQARNEARIATAFVTANRKWVAAVAILSAVVVALSAVVVAAAAAG